MKTLNAILAEPQQQRAGVTAVLAAADTARDRLERAQLVASFAPPVVHYSGCSCGSYLEIRGEVTTEDREAIADFDYVHADCGGDY